MRLMKTTRSQIGFGCPGLSNFIATAGLSSYKNKTFRMKKETHKFECLFEPFVIIKNTLEEVNNIALGDLLQFWRDFCWIQIDSLVPLTVCYTNIQMLNLTWRYLFKASFHFGDLRSNDGSDMLYLALVWVR